MIAVDERGGVIDGDQIIAICALDMKERDALRGDAVVGTVMSNLGLRRCLDNHGIEFVEVGVGDRAVLDELERRDLPLGGEQSGHIIFTDHSTTGDGALTGALLLDVIHGTGHSLGLLAGVMQKFPQILRNVSVRDRSGLDTSHDFWEEAAMIDRRARARRARARASVRHRACRARHGRSAEPRARRARRRPSRRCGHPRVRRPRRSPTPRISSSCAGSSASFGVVRRGFRRISRG